MFQFIRMSVSNCRLFSVVVAGFLIFTLASPASAVCGRECDEAKNFCKKYESDNPGFECGRVRGRICTGKDWVKIKQVNWAWSACRLARNQGQFSAAQIRCGEYENFWGGDCQVHSPRCKIGWVKLGKWGNFAACRKADLSGGVLYSGYRAYMRKFEGKAKHKIPHHLHAFLRKHYAFDPARIRFGWVGEVKGATCITDCYNVYCDAKATIDAMRNGYNWTSLPLHELQHSHQCQRKGSRKAYALYWFGQVPGTFFKALKPGDGADFSDAFHDGMPMEKEAFKREAEIHAVYVRDWWHRPGKCHVYKADKTTIVSELDGKVHPRFYCDPEFDQTGAKQLKAEAANYAKDVGDGRYYFAIGKPNENNGAWLGHVDIRHKILETSWAVKFGKESCPKAPTITAAFATSGIRPIRVRINHNGKPTKWHMLNTKKAGNGYLAVLDVKLPTLLGPEKIEKFRLEIEGQPPTEWKNVKVTCPPFRVLDVRYRFESEPGPVCPKTITTTEIYKTNGPGMVVHRRERKGGPPSKWMRSKSERDGKAYRLKIKSSQHVGEIDQERRIVARKGRLKAVKGTVASKWVRMSTKCIDVVESNLTLHGTAEALCPYKGEARVRFNTDMAGPVPYQVNCNNGITWNKTITAHKTGPKTFIAVDKHPLTINKTGKLACALKTNFNGKLKNVALRGRDYKCKDVLDAAVYIDGPAKLSCPAAVRVRVRFNSPSPLVVPYRLDCTPDRSWNRRARARKTGPKTYVAVDTFQLRVRKSGQVSCALKSKLSGALRVVALRGKKFQCLGGPGSISKPGGSGGAGPVPSTSANAPVCTGGVVRNRRCFCPRGTNRRRTGRQKFRCVKTNVSCIGGKIVRNRCRCPKNKALVRGRCITRAG